MGHPMDQVTGSYNQFLVLLSYLIAFTASYSALDLAGRINTSKGSNRLIWLVCGAASMGLGIWSMHFVGMLALDLPIKVSYNIELVGLSIILAVVVSSVALLTVTRKKLGLKEVFISGILMALGICGMHYIGMAAMDIDISYDTGWVVLSVIIAATASGAALWLLFYFRHAQSRFAILYKVGSALVMGAAISGMHYTGMLAAHFYPRESIDGGMMQIDPVAMAYIVAIGTFVLLGMTLFGVFINKRLSHKDLVIQEHEGWYRSLYKNNVDAIISIDTKGSIIGMNPAVTRIAGLTPEMFINKHVSALNLEIAEEDRERTKDLYYNSFDQVPTSYETTLIHANGKRIGLEIMNVPVEIDGNVVGNHLIARDITDEKLAKDQIKHLAYHDELTGLPNRRKFNQQILDSIEEANREGFSFAVMVIDIDRFKLINDSLGHTYGDLFLKRVSDRIMKSSQPIGASIARMGGDEFTVLCRTGSKGEAAAELAQSIINELKHPFRLKDNDFYISASIGLALYPDHGRDAEELLKKADTAMYEVKKHGKNGYKFYTRDLDKQLHGRVELENDLRKAIERNELLVYYQPQIRTFDSRMVGIEALIRWNHPTKGLLSPGLFIPLAEETGMIYEIGTWVLREACRQMREWHDTGGPLIPVSVNLSSRQFHQPDIVQYVIQILEETGLKPEYLDLEITESMMMDATVSTAILHELNNIGVRISLDDFGTGYSSLSYLKTFPIHKLKIDRSFITDISTNENDKAIVATIISMAQNLKLDVVAEGIETQDQLDILKENDCKEIQGYYFSRPLSAEEVEKSFFVPLRLV